MLFNEENRKRNVNSIDLLLYIMKLANESKIMTFSLESL
jgi:hypothetical protein